MRDVVRRTGWIFIVLSAGCLLPHAGVAADEAEQVTLVGAPGIVTAPGPGFERHTETPKPGQWSTEWRKDGLVLQARVFPVRGTSDPRAALVQAVATLAQVRRLGGFGVPAHHAVDVWGRPAADGRFQIAVDGQARAGRCRILLLTPKVWAFAWGLLGREPGTDDNARIRRFVESLEPREPAFFSLPFRVAERLEAVASPRPMKPVIRVRDLMATTGALEIAVGMRFSLSRRTSLLRLMAAHLRTTPAVADTYRETAEVVEVADSRPIDERHDALRDQGSELLAWFAERAKLDEDAARGVLQFLQEATGAAFEGGPRRTAVASHREMSAFLASVANDAPVVPRATRSAETRWATLGAGDREALRRAGATWAGLRYAWDNAQPDDRFRFRREVVRALAADPASPGLSAEASPRAVFRHLHEDADDGRAEVLFVRAAALSGAKVAALIALLAVDAPGYHLGW